MATEKTITVYEGNDGKSYGTMREALRADAKVRVIEALAKSSAYGELSIDAVMEVLDTNADIFVDYLTGCASK